MSQTKKFPLKKRESHIELLERCQLADFCWQRRELVVVDLKTRKCVVRSAIYLPQMPHDEMLEIGQQTERGRKRRELIATDLQPNRRLVRSHSNRSSTRSHDELLERCQLRNFARQRAKPVAVEPERIQIRHADAEQLGWQLRQIYASQLRKTFTSDA